MTIQTTRYSATSWAFMSQAEAALAKGDLAQASRRGWYAAAWSLRGFARERGWCYTGFYGIDGVMNRLEESSSDPEIDLHFSAARALERNAYDPWESRDSVAHGLREVAQLLRKLEQLP